jgi:hypothetical protein
MLLFLLSSLALRAPPHMVSRRSVIVTTVLSPTAVSAFDLPPPDGLVAAFNPYDIKALEDPNVRSKFAAAPNPDKARQQSSAYFAVSNGDIDSLQAMADGGWALAELADDNGKTLLHRAAQIGNEPAATSPGRAQQSPRVREAARRRGRVDVGLVQHERRHRFDPCEKVQVRGRL